MIFFGEKVYNQLLHMKFRIIQKHDGDNYCYIIQQLWFIFWKKPEDYKLSSVFSTCKDAELAIDKYDLKINTNNIIVEKEIIVL